MTALIAFILGVIVGAAYALWQLAIALAARTEGEG